MYDRWKKSRLNWRVKTGVEEFEMEESEGLVYSPKGGSREEMEKIQSREKLRKDRRLENDWEELYRSRIFLQENQSGWKNRNTTEMRMIRVEEKRERLRMKTENERKFGKKIATHKNMNKKDDELALMTRRKIEICQARTNIEAVKKDQTVGVIKPNGKLQTRICTDKKKTLQEILKDNQHEREKRAEDRKENWKVMKESLEIVEELEGWKKEDSGTAKEYLLTKETDKNKESSLEEENDVDFDNNVDVKFIRESQPTIKNKIKKFEENIPADKKKPKKST